MGFFEDRANVRFFYLIRKLSFSDTLVKVLSDKFGDKFSIIFNHVKENDFCLNFEVSKSRSNHQRRSIKKVFLKISQNWQENTCTRVSFLKTTASANSYECIDDNKQIWMAEFWRVQMFIFI